MPVEINITPYVSKDYKSDYILSTDDSHPDADHSDREMSRSETSSCSDESGCYKQNGLEMVEIIPTRTTKTSVPKPAANPLQFVKIGPCDLYRSAQKQIQKVSDVTKPAKKEIKDEMEDWQSNLDSWKCNRRKQQEHIIERVVEVKKLELQEHDRNRKKTKTFSEMMEERTSKGRKLNVPLYLEEESDDLSNLGISSTGERNETEPIVEEEIDISAKQTIIFHEEEDYGHDSMKSKSGQNSDCNGADEVDHASTTCESTYESAIQNYETRMKSLTNGSSVASSTCQQIRKSMTSIPTTTTTTSSTTFTTSPLHKYGRRASARKIEEKLSELERIKNRSVSSTDLTETNKKSMNIPKVNIFKRKEMFENVSETNVGNKSRRTSGELSAVRSIKERLSSLEKTIEGTSCGKTKNVPVSEVSVKDRLSSINERISEENVNVVPEKSIYRERRLPHAKCKPTEEMNGSSKVEDESVAAGESSGRSSSWEDYEHMHPQVNHFHHRSLDSLQGHDSANDFCFERVQSLECIDCCSNYPASVLSGDTDREDSGIHTADVSSSVSQADDFDMHADTSMDVDVKSHNAAALINKDDSKADKSSHSGFCIEEVRQRIDIMEQNLVDGGANETALAESGGIETTSMQRSGEDRRRVELESGDENQNTAAVIETEEVSIINDSCLIDDSHNDVDGVQEEELFVNEEVSLTRSDDPLNEQIIKLERKGKDNPELGNQQDEADVHQNFNQVNEFTVTNQNYEHMNLLNNQFKDGQSNDLARSDSMFAFEPSMMSAEPPKEKPPPPPLLENSDEELEKSENVNLLRRIDSTKRIKKEMRLKRSSFLGIEGYDDESYLTPDLEAVKPPPDMTTFLEEERRLEKMLYRQSICSESDSMQGESRDSGVELDKNHNDENSWPIERVDRRQDSETCTYMSTASEEDEIIKKEREILEILELEEQRNYQNDIKNECVNNLVLGEKLVLKLKELENQKNGPYWKHENEQPYLDNQPKTFHQTCSNYEEHLLHPTRHPKHQSVNQSADSKLLHRQRSGCSLQDITGKNVSSSNAECTQLKTRLDYRNSMPDIQQEIQNPNQHYRKQPPAIPHPSHCRESNVINKVSSPQQMSKQTLQALSAVPRSKIVATDSWVQSRKKPRQEAYNHKHWLIQEAEHRRLIEYRQRQSKETLNVHQESAESNGTVEAPLMESNAGALHLATSPHRSTMYAHSQMLPVSKQNQNYNAHEDENTNKSQYPSSSISSNCNINNSCSNKPLPDSVIQTLTQRVQNRFTINDASKQRRRDSHPNTNSQQEKMLSVSGKKKCSHCGDELGRGAAMIIESLRLFYHIDCFRCCVCCVQLGDGLMGTDVRVRNSKLHCHSCYSNDEGLKFSCV